MASLAFNELQAALEHGVRDYKRGVLHANNPYMIPTLRVAWEEGWEEAQLESLWADNAAAARNEENYLKVC